MARARQSMHGCPQVNQPTAQSSLPDVGVFGRSGPGGALPGALASTPSFMREWMQGGAGSADGTSLAEDEPVGSSDSNQTLSLADAMLDPTADIFTSIIDYGMKNATWLEKAIPKGIFGSVAGLPEFVEWMQLASNNIEGDATAYAWDVLSEASMSGVCTAATGGLGAVPCGWLASEVVAQQNKIEEQYQERLTELGMLQVQYLEQVVQQVSQPVGISTGLGLQGSILGAAAHAGSVMEPMNSHNTTVAGVGPVRDLASHGAGSWSGRR